MRYMAKILIWNMNGVPSWKVDDKYEKKTWQIWVEYGQGTCLEKYILPRLLWIVLNVYAPTYPTGSAA